VLTGGRRSHGRAIALRSSVKDILGCIRARLGGAVAVARAAETCAEAGEVEQALPIILDVEQSL